MKQLNEYDGCLKRPHPVFVYENYINDIEFPTREIIKENSEHKIFARQATMDIPEGDELSVSFCNQKYFESVLKEFKLFSKVRPKLFKKVVDGDYEFGKDVIVKAEYCVNNLRTYFDKEPTVRDPKNIFDLIIFGDNFVDFEICELDMYDNDVNLHKIECRKNTAVLFPYVPSSWNRQRIKEFDGKSVRISFIVEDSLQEINPKICNQRVKIKGKVIVGKEQKIIQDLLIKEDGDFDPWGLYLFDDYLRWDDYVELEQDFPFFKETKDLIKLLNKDLVTPSGIDISNDQNSLYISDDETNSLYTLDLTSFKVVQSLAGEGFRDEGVHQASDVDEKITLSPKWEKMVDYHTSRYYFQNTFSKFDGIWKTWRPKLREKIMSREFTMGYVPCKTKMKYIPESEQPDIGYDFKFIHDDETLNRDGLEVHVDRSDKIIQSMIYFRHPEDRCNDANLQLHCHHGRDPGEIISKIDYISNRCVVVPYTPISYHSVSPGDRTGNPYTRKMVNVIFRVRPGLDELSDI